MASALDAAAYLLRLAEEDNTVVTHLKLQKLCYYAQGYSLALMSEPMFDEPIEAWEHGPVVRALWNEYKSYGSQPIPAPSHDAEIEPWRARLLDQVDRRFGWMTAWDLRNQTHDEMPWREAWLTGGESSEISHDAMRDFFRVELRGARRAPKPVDRSVVLAHLEQDDDLRSQVARGRADIEAGRVRKWR